MTMIPYKALTKKLIQGTISEEERQLLHEWVSQSDDHLNKFSKTLKVLESSNTKSFDAEEAYQKFLDTVSKEKGKVFKLSRYYKYAAVLIIAISLGYFVANNFGSDINLDLPEVTNTETKSNPQDITITLTDGTTKIISDNSNEALTDANGNVVAKKEANTLDFSGNSEKSELKYSEIYVPFGKTLKIKLSDGTLVWLNAGTHFKFPEDFSLISDTRTVHLEGEAYFDVTKNKDKPFIVNVDDVNIEVLGTQFNVSSYENDSNIATTLVEGSVNVYQNSVPENKLQLSPDYQAVYSKTGNNFSKTIVDTEVYIGWIENKLIINNLKFTDILKRLERKHNVAITNNAPHLNLEIYKGEFTNESIEEVLNTIALSTPFNFEINESNIIITK